MNEVLTKQNTLRPNGLNVVLGIWVLISPFALGFASMQAAMWNDIATGIAVLVLAAVRSTQNQASAVFNVLLGGWLIVSAFVLGFSTPVPFWNNIVLGIIIAISALVALSHREHPAVVTPPNPGR